MQSADSSLGLSWWLLYQMPGKLQGFRTFRTTWLRLEPDYLLATAYVEFIYTLGRQIAQASFEKSVPFRSMHVEQHPIAREQIFQFSVDNMVSGRITHGKHSAVSQRIPQFDTFGGF